jgi:hypothetical protein
MAGVRAPCFLRDRLGCYPVGLRLFRAGLLMFHDLAPRNLCGALLPCACTQQFSGVRQPYAIKRGGGFPLQCVLGVVAHLFHRPFLRASAGLDSLTVLDAGDGEREADREGKN